MQRLAADTHATSSTVSTLVRNAESTSTLIAGAGLTGGGPLNSSTPVTLNVGAGTGILVAADSISFDTSVLSGYVTGSGTNQRLLKWNGTGSVAADSHIAEGTTGAFVASFNTNDLTADRTYQFVDPYAAFPYVVTGTDTSSYVSPDCAVALWSGQGQVDSHDGLIFGVGSKNLLIGDGSIGGSPGITIRARDSVGNIQDATIQLRVGDPPTVTYRSAVTGGNHNFIGNQPSFTAVVSVTGGVTGSWFNRVNITDPGSPNTATITLTANKTLAATNTLTLSGTDSTTHTFPSTSSNVARIDAAQTFTGEQTFDDGIRLGEATVDTIGRINSRIANASGVKSIQLKPEVALTSNTDRWTHTMEDSAGNVRFSIASNGGISLYAEGATNNGIVSLVGTAATTMNFGIYFGPTFTSAGTSVSQVAAAGVVSGYFLGTDNASCSASIMVGGILGTQGAVSTRAHSEGFIGAVIAPVYTWAGPGAAVSHGTIYGFKILPVPTAKSTLATAVYGGFIPDMLGGTTPATTDQYGLWVGSQTRATNKYGIWLDGTTAGYKAIVLGSTSNWIAPESSTTFSLNATTVFHKCDTDIASGKKITYNASQQLLWGTGTPESVVTATVGSVFLRTDGGASTTLYIKESGSGNTGWIAK